MMTLNPCLAGLGAKNDVRPGAAAGWDPGCGVCFARSDHHPTIPITATNTSAANSCQRVPSPLDSMILPSDLSCGTMIVRWIGSRRNDAVQVL